MDNRETELRPRRETSLDHTRASAHSA
jgi:hypothetical protein